MTAIASSATSPMIGRMLNEGVVTLTLDQAQSRNALSDAMIAALHAELDSIAADQTVRAVIIEARGPAFCAGHDLKEITAHRGDADQGRQFFNDLMARCSAMMQ